MIRAWDPSNAKPARALLSTVAADYPAFDKWLEKKFGDVSASKKVVVVDGVVAAFSMWQAKDRRNVKLQTFIAGRPSGGQLSDSICSTMKFVHGQRRQIFNVSMSRSRAARLI